MIVATHTPIGIITTQITLEDVSTLVVTTEGVATASFPALRIETKEIALRGPPGPGGDEAAISTDANNRLTLGSDGKLLVPDVLDPSPLAHYLLQRGNI